MKAKAKLIFDAQDKLGEGIIWCPLEKALYWVDVPMPAKIHRLDPATGDHKEWSMPEMVMSLAKRRDGTLLVASHRGVNVFDPRDGELKRVIAPEADKPDNRSNDGAPDALGRFWYGSMANNIADDNSYFAPEGAHGVIWKIESDWTAIPVESGVGISNATCWSPDWKTFYFADTALRTIFAWDFDLQLGALANKRVFSNVDGYGYPDGACVDAKGFVWNARWEGGCVIRFAPDGSIDRIVEVPAHRVTSCTFGGDALDTLYITTSRLHLSAQELAQHPFSGGLFSIRPGVHGLARPQFGG